ncbi:MAG: hypothetical protein IIW27_05615 [Clostridia bacterium]|nr:hypothetical protein [Clostridia bacterium]
MTEKRTKLFFARKRHSLYFAAIAALFCAVLALAPASAYAGQTVKAPKAANDTLVYPSDYRDFYAFNAPEYVFATQSLIAVLDGESLVLLNGGTVLVCPATPFLGKAVSFQLYDTADVDFLLAYGGDGVYYLPLDGETTALAPIETLRSFEGAAFAVSEGYLYTKARTVKKYQLSASGTVLTALDNPETVSLPGDYEARFESSRHFIVLEDGTLCYTASDGSTLRVGETDYPLSEKPQFITASGTDVYYASFFGTEETVYRVSPSGETKLFSRQVARLGGIAAANDTLYLCDVAKANVLKYSLSGGATLSGAIGAYASDTNRLSSSASAVAEHDGTLYVADGGNNRILAYDGSYAAIELGFSPTYLAVSDDYFLTGSPSTCRLIRKADGTLHKELTPQSGTFAAVTYSSNGRFYILTQTPATETESATFNVYEYRISATDGTPLHFAGGEGTVIALTTDLNNNVYLLKADGTVAVYGTNGEEKETSFPTFEGAVDLQVDFENNLYLLYPNNTIAIVSDGETVAQYKLLTWSSYLSSFTPKKFVISFLEKPCYVLYNGFILRTENVVRSTPVEISVPEGVNLSAPKQKTDYLSAQSGAIFFRFDLASYLQTGTPTLGYEQLSAPQTYVLLGESGNYYYVLKDSDAGFIRKDAATKEEREEPLSSPKQAQTLVSCTLYHFPVINDITAVTPNAKTLQKGATLTLLRTITHNGVDFYALTYDFNGEAEGGEGVAYIAKALVTLSPANETEPLSYQYHTARKDSGEMPVIYDSEQKTTALYTFTQSAKVKVFAVENGFAQVVYEYEVQGETRSISGYMESRFLKTEGNNMALIGLVVLALIISVVCSTGFLIKRHAARTQEEEY